MHSAPGQIGRDPEGALDYHPAETERNVRGESFLGDRYLSIGRQSEAVEELHQGPALGRLPPGDSEVEGGSVLRQGGNIERRRGVTCVSLTYPDWLRIRDRAIGAESAHPSYRSTFQGNPTESSKETIAYSLELNLWATLVTGKELTDAIISAGSEVTIRGASRSVRWVARFSEIENPIATPRSRRTSSDDTCLFEMRMWTDTSRNTGARIAPADTPRRGTCFAPCVRPATDFSARQPTNRSVLESFR
ncbi:MAG TPA: hypothetical protein DCG06_01630 [Deltaproteobacteria bacterium]|nr:hypothetical protein [Deltaproteobacteria bacterium]